MGHFHFFLSGVLDFSALELLEKVLARAILGGLRMENLFHDLLYHLILLPDQALLTEQLCSKLLILSSYIIQLLFQIYFFLVQSFFIRVF